MQKKGLARKDSSRDQLIWFRPVYTYVWVCVVANLKVHNSVGSGSSTWNLIFEYPVSSKVQSLAESLAYALAKWQFFLAKYEVKPRSSCLKFISSLPKLVTWVLDTACDA